MKEIVEEWKTIEDYPNYEISNMGRCRIKKSGKLKEKYFKHCGSHKVIKYKMAVYKLSKNNVEHFYSAGMLVARHFIPNPNGCKYIGYKDEDVNNACYWNIEWRLIPKINKATCVRTKRTREGQIENYRINRDRIDRIIKYLENGKIGDLINDEIMPIIKKAAEKRFPLDKIDEFVSYATEYYADVLSRGHTIISIERQLGHLILKFYRNLFGNNTVSLDEARARDNEKEII
jgi:hypothetical protein